MKAMILAAGLGKRMQPLTSHTPKPLLKVGGIPLIEYHIRKLASAGICEIVINVSWLAQQIIDYLGDGKQFGVSIQYSIEADEPLETAGGIANALPLIAPEDSPFLVVNGDIFTGFDFKQLPQLSSETLAHLWLVENPAHNLKGDFILSGNALLNVTDNSQANSFTFSGIGLYRADFFKQCAGKKVLALGPLLKQAVEQKRICGELLTKSWTDVGTPERLATLNKELSETF